MGGPNGPHPPREAPPPVAQTPRRIHPVHPYTYRSICRSRGKVGTVRSRVAVLFENLISDPFPRRGRGCGSVFFENSRPGRPWRSRRARHGAVRHPGPAQPGRSRDSLREELPAPFQGSGIWGGATRGWQTAPAPGYMPEPLRGRYRLLGCQRPWELARDGHEELNCLGRCHWRKTRFPPRCP
jgi:hypothetical protein